MYKRYNIPNLSSVTIAVHDILHDAVYQHDFFKCIEIETAYNVFYIDRSIYRCYRACQQKPLTLYYTDVPNSGSRDILKSDLIRIPQNIVNTNFVAISIKPISLHETDRPTFDFKLLYNDSNIKFMLIVDEECPEFIYRYNDYEIIK